MSSNYPPSDQPPYPPPPAYGGGYGGGAGYGPPPPNFLIPAILVTIFCCLPGGIVAIVFASQVNSKWAAGDAAGARDASRKAKLVTIWSAVLGLVALILFWVLYGAAMMQGGMYTPPTG
jgi:hypothetical protein